MHAEAFAQRTTKGWQRRRHITRTATHHQNESVTQQRTGLCSAQLASTVFLLLLIFHSGNQLHEHQVEVLRVGIVPD